MNDPTDGLLLQFVIPNTQVTSAINSLGSWIPPIISIFGAITSWFAIWVPNRAKKALLTVNVSVNKHPIKINSMGSAPERTGEEWSLALKIVNCGERSAENIKLSATYIYGRDLHLMLEQQISNRDCFVYQKTDTVRSFFYINTSGEREVVLITDMDKFDAEVTKIMGSAKRRHLSPDEIQYLITSNGGHTHVFSDKHQKNVQKVSGNLLPKEETCLSFDLNQSDAENEKNYLHVSLEYTDIFFRKRSYHRESTWFFNARGNQLLSNDLHRRAL